jgi:hypothetical protein
VTVRGPQLRAVARWLNVIRRSRAVDGTQLSRGGHSSVNSVASIFKTLRARMLKSLEYGCGNAVTLSGARPAACAARPEPRSDSGARPTFSCNPALSRRRGEFTPFLAIMVASCPRPDEPGLWRRSIPAIMPADRTAPSEPEYIVKRYNSRGKYILLRRK